MFPFTGYRAGYSDSALSNNKNEKNKYDFLSIAIPK